MGKEPKQSWCHFIHLFVAHRPPHPHPGTRLPGVIVGTPLLSHPSRTPAAPRLFTADKDTARERLSAAHHQPCVPHPHPFPTCIWVPLSLLFLPPSKSLITDPSVRPTSPPEGRHRRTPQIWPLLPKPPHSVLPPTHQAPQGLGRPRGHHCPRGLPSMTQGDVYSQAAPATQSNHLCVRRGLGRSGRCTSLERCSHLNLNPLENKPGWDTGLRWGWGNLSGSAEIWQGHG